MRRSVLCGPIDLAATPRMRRLLARIERAARVGFALWSRLMAGALALLFFLAFAAPAFALESDALETAELCRFATDQAERAHGTPPGLLRAVSLVESGRRIDGARVAWPWTINLEGAGHWFDSREEALAFARAALEAGKTSFDIGCMQINYRWHHQEFGSLEEMFDPAHNADYAARFLTALETETGDWMHAAGFYHSRTPTHSERYRTLVAAAYEDARQEQRTRARAVAQPAVFRQATAEAEAARTPEPSPVRAPAPEPVVVAQVASWPNYNAGSALVPALDAAPRPLIAAARPPDEGGGLLRQAKPLF